jgi:hypothetical protein
MLLLLLHPPFLPLPLSPSPATGSQVYFEPGIVRGGLATYESIRSKKGNKWAAKIHRTRGLLETRFPNVNDGNAVLHFVKHAPFSMSRTLLEQMAATWPSEYRVTAELKFRDYETVDIPTMHNMYCQVGGHVVPSVPRGLEGGGDGMGEGGS